jgi:hypothetical protein
VRLQVVTAASVKITTFCDVTSFNLVETDRRFRGAYYLHHKGDSPDNGRSSTSERSICLCETRRCNIPEGCHLCLYCFYEFTVVFVLEFGSLSYDPLSVTKVYSFDDRVTSE